MNLIFLADLKDLKRIKEQNKSPKIVFTKKGKAKVKHAINPSIFLGQPRYQTPRLVKIKKIIEDKKTVFTSIFVDINPKKYIIINDIYTKIFIKLIPIKRSEINKGIIGMKTLNNLLFIFFEEKSAIPVIGAKFGG